MFSAEEIPEDATQPETVNIESENKSDACKNRKPASFVEFEYSNTTLHRFSFFGL